MSNVPEVGASFATTRHGDFLGDGDGSSLASGPPGLSLAVVNLCRGPVYRDGNTRAWLAIEANRAHVSDHVNVMGLELVLDPAEGYAFLRSREREEGPDVLPRLVARRPLSLPVSLLLALLRKRLAEFDASSADPRLVLSREQIVEMVRLFLPTSTNEARLVDQVDTYIAKVVDLGFLRRLKGTQERFEVQRIIKAFVDGQWLADLDARLGEYLAELDHEGGEGKEA